jgi:hydrogenase/urease accessory protein HupE
MSRLTVLSLVVLSTPALAHTGEHHGNLFTTLFHLLSEPDHLALAAIAVGAGVFGFRAWRRARARSDS